MLEGSVHGSHQQEERHQRLPPDLAQRLTMYRLRRKVVIEDVKVSNFTGGGSSPAGIYLLDVENLAIRRTVVHDDSAPGGPGIWLDGGLPRQGVIEDSIAE